jgi:hypothetical protein
MKFAKFMASPSGRAFRVILGLAMIISGVLMGSILGYVIAFVGLLPLISGIFDWCVCGPLLKMPLSGKNVRACEVKPPTETV